MTLAVRIGDIAEQVRGVSYSKSDVRTNPEHGFIPLLRGGNITENGLEWDGLQYVPASIVSDKQLLSSGDVVIAASSGSLSSVGKSGSFETSRVATFGAFCKVMRPNQNVDPRYFANYFKTNNYRNRISQLAAGANINNLRNEHLNELVIPLPPLPEQRRIAAILDKADLLRTQRREALTHLDALTQSVFISMFGNPVSNSMDWDTAAFESVAPSRLGKMLDKKKQTNLQSFDYLRNANVRWFDIQMDDLFQMNFSDHERIEFELKPGDVLICEGGEPGRAAIWRGSRENCYFQKALHRARPLPEKIKPEYLVHLLWHLSHSGGLADHVTSATIAHLTGAKLKRLRIPVPPLELQQTFARRVAGIEKLKEQHRAQLAELDALFASLQHRAFKGEL